MQRNTINRPFVFSAKFLARQQQASLFREVMLMIAVVCFVGLALDSVARMVGV